MKGRRPLSGSRPRVAGAFRRRQSSAFPLPVCSLARTRREHFKTNMYVPCFNSCVYSRVRTPSCSIPTSIFFFSPPFPLAAQVAVPSRWHRSPPGGTTKEITIHGSCEGVLFHPIILNRFFPVSHILVEVFSDAVANFRVDCVVRTVHCWLRGRTPPGMSAVRLSNIFSHFISVPQL